MPVEKIYIEEYPIDPRIRYIKIKLDNIQLHDKDCWVDIFEFDRNHKELDRYRFHIPQDIYQDWATDDDYILEYIMDHFGFVRRKTLYLPIDDE